MAMQGLAYLKTTWAFEERPVASLKLNMWDDRIEAALELIFFLLNQNWGGGNGVIQGATTDDLCVKALAVPGFYVQVKPGYGFISKFPYKLTQTMDTATITPPATHNRIDLVEACLDTWSVHIKTGNETQSPAAPSPSANCIALAHLYLRPGMTCIKDADDQTNGYIIDARTLLE